MKLPPFLDFLRMLGVKLTRAQRVLCSVCFGGVQPSTFEGADREAAQRLLGDVDTIPPELLTVIEWVKGARVGGTWLASLRLLHLALTVELSSLAAGEVAFVLLVGPDMRLPRQGLRYIVGALKSRSELASMLIAESTDSATLRRPDGREVVFEIMPATKGGSAVRGRSLVGALFTEASFFRDKDFAINVDDVYRGVLPRILAGGQLILETTPWAQLGLVYELFDANWGKPTTCVVAHCPTLLMRSDARTISLVERERNRDPENARREFDGEFLARGASAFFDPVAINQAVSDDAMLANRNTMRAAACDLGLVVNSSTLVVACEPVTGSGNFVVCESIELRPEPGVPLKPSEIARTFALCLRRHTIDLVMADIHYLESLRENLAPFRIGVVPLPTGIEGKFQQFSLTRTVLHEGRLGLPNDRRMVEQLKSVTSRPNSGGSISILQPKRRDGSHGDIASALVGSVWALEYSRSHPPRTRSAAESENLRRAFAGELEVD